MPQNIVDKINGIKEMIDDLSSAYAEVYGEEEEGEQEDIAAEITEETPDIEAIENLEAPAMEDDEEDIIVQR